jgi:SAM-dependent methyltransferase
VADAVRLPFPSGSVDAVLMCEILEHLPDPRRALAEAHRVLCAGGTLCGSVPFIMPIHGDPGDFFRYTGDGLRYLMSEFADVHVRGHGNHVGGAWRLIRTRFRALRLLDPIGRRLSASPNERCPEGYTFVAKKQQTLPEATRPMTEPSGVRSGT